MGKGRIEKSFFDDGFKVTYYDGVTERFHRNLLDNNFKGDKGSSIIERWLDGSLTVLKYDGSKENFQIRDSKEFLAGDKGTRVREGFWGDYYISENPYSDYKPPTIADVRKAKYQETPIREYQLERNADTTLEKFRSDIKDIIEAAKLKVHISDVTVDGHPAVAIVSNDNSAYMPVYSYFSDEGRIVAINTSVRGKGNQTTAADLSKLFYKAASPWGKVQIKASKGSAIATHFGYALRSKGIAGGLGFAATFAAARGVSLAAKGVKVLLRDNNAYQQEMDFYNQAAGVIDYAVGYNDSYGLNQMISERAQNGIPSAQYQMGIAYIYGIGVEGDEETAFKWFVKAAECGDLRSQNIVAGEYLYNTEKVYSLQQKEQAVTYLYNLASFGENWAWELLIDIYGKGTVPGISPDYDEAVRIAEYLAKEGNVHAALFLAPLYDTQAGSACAVPDSYKNDSLAFEQYRIIAGNDSGENGADAEYKLACMCMEGRGTECNKALATDYLKRSASKGNINAKVDLLEAYTFNRETERSSHQVKKLAQEIKRYNDPAFVSTANYCLFKNAVYEKRYGEGLKYAKEYLSGEYSEAEKSEEIKKYIADMEERISHMSDKERRQFLNESGKITDILIGFGNNINWDFKNKKAILIIVFVIIVAATVIGVITAGNNESGNNTSPYAVNNKDSNTERNLLMAEASSFLDKDGDITYYPDNVMDDDISTAWVEGEDGNGEGEWIRIPADSDGEISAVRIVNGYQKSEEAYYKNNRVKEAELIFDDGSSEFAALADEFNKSQVIILSEPKNTDYILLKIKSVYEGDEWQDTCISELSVAEAAAGINVLVINASPSENDNNDSDNNESIADSLSLFDETVWTCSRGQTVGAQSMIKFHSDGSFSEYFFGTEQLENDAGTWYLDEESQTLHLFDDAAYTGGEEEIFVMDGDQFRSEEPVEMMGGEDYQWLSPATDDQGYLD